MSILIVLLVLLLLLLEELELALPQSTLFVELGLKISMEPVSLVVLDLPLLSVLTSTALALGHGLLKFLILLAELHILLLEIVNELLLAALEVLVLLAGDCRLTLMLRVCLLDRLFEVLEGLPLLLVLLVDVLLLLLDSGNPLLHRLGRVLLLLLEAFFVPLNSLTLLLVVLVDPLLLKTDLLFLESTITLKVDLGLSQVVDGLFALDL